MNRLEWLRNALAQAGYDLTRVEVSLLDSRTALVEFEGDSIVCDADAIAACEAAYRLVHEPKGE